MPVSGNEEMGDKPSVGQFREYSAGIPIKKRRFPFWSPSQSTEDSPSLPTENEPEQKGFSSSLQGSALSKDTIVAMSSNNVGVEASLNTSGTAGSLNVSVAASPNASCVAASSNATCVALSYTASGVTAASKASSIVETLNASSVAASFSNVTSIAESVSSFSDANEKSMHEKEKRSSDDTDGRMVKGNLLRVKLEEQSFAVHPRSLADIDSKGKLVATEPDNILRKLAKSEMDLVVNDSLTLNIGKDIYNQQNIDGKCISQLPTVCGNPGLSLDLRECLSAVASGNNEHGIQNQEKAEPVSLNLSLSKGDCSTQIGTNVQPDTNGANVLADRTNWDLNTTMDSWESLSNDGVASQKATHVDDIKPIICSAGMTSTGMSTQQKMLEGIDHRAKIKMSSGLSSQPYSTEDSLQLGLTRPYLHLNSTEKPPSSSAKVDLRQVIADISSPGESVPASKMTVGNLKPVKSEPLDESIKNNSAGVKAKPMGLFSIPKVKCELVEKCSSECSKSSTLSTSNLNDATIKSETVREGNQETPKRMDESLNQSDEQMLRLDTTTIPTSRVPTSTDLSLRGDVSTHVEHFVQAKEIEPSGEGQAAGHDINELNVSGKIDDSTSQNKNVEDPDHCRLKFMNVQLPDSRGTVEGSASDEEKINLSGDMLEEDSYGSDYESGDNRELAATIDMEHDGRAEEDFEDGEVREPVMNTEIEVPICERQEAGNGNNGDTGYRNSDFVRFVGDNPSSSSAKEKEILSEHPGKTSIDNTNESIDASVNKDLTTEADKEVCLEESSAVEMPSNQTDKKRPINVMPRKSLDVSEKEDTVKWQEGELTSVQALDTSQGISVTIAQGADDAKTPDSEGKSNLVLPKADAFFNGDDDAGKDVNNGTNRSRIINLSRASNLSSPGRTRSISDRTLQSQVGRERLPEVALEGDKFHSRGRDEDYDDGSHRFSRERHHDQPSRNNRISFMRGRGRISSRIDTLHGDQDSEHNFASEFYNGPTEFRVVRHKYASAVSDADLNFSSYNNGQDGAYFGTGRGRRKILSNDSSIFSHLPPRRRSPGGRDGPVAHGLPMVRRVPSRCIGEDGSELVGFRHMRGFADDHTDPMFARSQPSFEGLDGSFVRGNREFSSLQRRGPPRIRSKSPTRLRTRSPGPWPSVRRRSPDGFGGPLELPNRRSPPIYRTERIRSPDPCFSGEMVIRRHGSPPYLARPSNDLRDLDPGRHPRSGISNRSPSGRILLRNNRRLDLVDSRERNEGDDYFAGPMPSGRFHELSTDGNTDERRRYGDRRGPVRSFRTPYGSTDRESFDPNAEGGPRSFRFCPEDDLEFHERGNMRERDFDRRIKNRPGNPPQRTRNIDEQEGNFRPGGQVWHDDGFDDISRVKRKRFRVGL